MTMEFESYIELAREDLDAARTLVRKPKHSGHAAFHVEQAAEKLIKAVLRVEQIDFSAMHHQLGRLAESLPADHDWAADFMSFDRFSSFATKFRYPTPGGKVPAKPDPKEISAHIDQVAAMVDDVLDWCRATAQKKRTTRRK